MGGGKGKEEGEGRRRERRGGRGGGGERGGGRGRGNGGGRGEEEGEKEEEPLLASMPNGFPDTVFGRRNKTIAMYANRTSLIHLHNEIMEGNTRN